MNSKKCKQLRQMFYGELSHKIDRVYVVDRNGGTINHPETPRAKYLAAKRLYKKRRQNN